MSTHFPRCDSCGGQLGHFSREDYMERAVCRACGLKHYRDVDDARMFDAPYHSTRPVDLLMSLQADEWRKPDLEGPVLLSPPPLVRPMPTEADNGQPAPVDVCRGDSAEMFTLSFLLVPGQAPRMIAAPRFSRPVSEHTGDERAFLTPLVQAAVLNSAQSIAREALGQGPFPLQDLDRELLRDIGFQRHDNPSWDCETWGFDDGTLYVQFFDGERDLSHWKINGRGLSRKDFFTWFVRELVQDMHLKALMREGM